MKNILSLVLIILLALILRLFNLASLPPSLNWDEISLGYNAYSIFKTGQDEWGTSFPLSFRAYGDYKLPLYVYLDVPFVAIFGLNEWGVRLLSALAGAGTVIFIFLILKRLTGQWGISLWGTFLASILPWSIILSRIALEANLSLFLTTVAFYLFLLGLDKKGYLIISSLFFGLTIFAYNSSRVVTPLLILVLITLFWKKLKNRFAFTSLLIFLVFFFMALPHALLQDSSARYKWTSVLDEGAINRINELRGSSALPPFFATLQYNKITFMVPEITKNYISHFDPRFLFLQGGSNFQYSVPGQGLILSVSLPFLLLGLWQILIQRSKWQLLLLAWLLLAPVPAAITRDAPHALRSLLMIPPLVMIVTLGVSRVLEWIKFKSAGGVLLVLLLLGNYYIFWQNYSGDYAKNYSWSWQYGYKEVVDFISQNGDKYNQIILTKKYGEPHEFLLFYMQYDPEKYQTDPNLVRYSRSNWYWVDGFDKYKFINDWEVKDEARCKCLLVTSPENYPNGSKLLQTINFLDGKKAFDIVELPQVQ